MKMFIILALLVAVGYVVYQHYVPEDLKERGAATVGAIREGDGQAVRAALGKIALPEDPAERRAILMRTLQETLAELRREIEGAAPAVSGTSAELLQRGEVLVDELLHSSETAPVRSGVVSRALDRIFPREDAAVCP